MKESISLLLIYVLLYFKHPKKYRDNEGLKPTSQHNCIQIHCATLLWCFVLFSFFNKYKADHEAPASSCTISPVTLPPEG